MSQNDCLDGVIVISQAHFIFNVQSLGNFDIRLQGKSNNVTEKKNHKKIYEKTFHNITIKYF